MSANPKEKALPQRLHHNARVVKDHERTHHFYEDIIGMPLIATWAEVGHFPEFPERPISYCHTFYGLADGGALAFFGFAEPDVYEAVKATVQSDSTTSRLPYPRTYRLRSSKISKREDIRRASSITVTVSRYMSAIPTI